MVKWLTSWPQLILISEFLVAHACMFAMLLLIDLTPFYFYLAKYIHTYVLMTFNGLHGVNQRRHNHASSRVLGARDIIHAFHHCGLLSSSVASITRQMEQMQQLVLSPEAIQAIVQGLASNETLVSAIAEKVSNTRGLDSGRGSSMTTQRQPPSSADASESTQNTTIQSPTDLSGLPNTTNSTTSARPKGISTNPPRGKLLLNPHIKG